MTNDLVAARQRLQDGTFTCVVLCGKREYVSHERGVKPLLTLLESEQSYSGGVAADKTVGAGVAYLYVLLGIRLLWANVISASALAILQQHGVEVRFGEFVPHIINRRGDGICPIETAVEKAKTPEEAYWLIVDALMRLEKDQ